MYFHSVNEGFIEIPKANASLNIYTVGCEHHCDGCQAKDLQNINHKDRRVLTSKLIIDSINRSKGFLDGICWLGGDPFFQFADCYHISKDIKKELPNILNVVFTGYTFLDFYKNINIKAKQDIENNMKEKNNIFDYIIDGKWNGHKLGDIECNQKVYQATINGFKEINYKEYCEK
jgi:organic radical activating enzyme